MSLILLKVKKWGEVAINLSLLYYLHYDFDGHFSFQTLPEILEIEQLLGSKEVRIAIPKFQDVRLIFCIDWKVKVFAKFNLNDIEDLISSL